MKLTDLKSLYLSLHTAVKDANRVYAIDDDVRLVVSMSFRVESRDEAKDLHLDPVVCVVANIKDRGNTGWERAELETLTAKQLLGYVELRSVVEQWIEGKLDTLPASTAKSPFDDDDEHNHTRRRRCFIG